MSEYVYAGLTSQTIDIFLQDSSSTTGQGLSGLVFNSAGLVASYRKGAAGTRTAITLATQTVGGAYSSGGFVEIEATHMKGVYRLDLPNAAVDTEGFVTLYLYGATNLLPTALRIDCRAIPADVRKIATQTATAAAGVTFPTTIASPTNITAATGVVLSGVTHTGAVIPTVTTLTTRSGFSLTATTGLGNQTANITGNLSGSVGSVTGAVGSVTGNVGGNLNGNVVGSVGSVSGNVGGNVSGNVSGSVGSVTGAVGSVTGSVGSVVGNVGGSTASVSGAVGSVTGNVGGDVAGKVLGGGVGTFSGDGVRAASVTGAVGSVTGSVGSVVANVTSELDSATNTKITDINTFATRMTTAISQDGLVWQFTVNALENAPSGGGGGGSATLANQEIIIDMIDAYLVSITAAAQETPGTIAGFPATLNVGDSYTDEMDNAITITLVDDQNNPVDTWGDYDVNHVGFTPTLVISGSGGKVTAAVTYDTDHFLVEIPSSESLRASPGTATMQFVLKWYVADRLVAQKTIVTGQAVTWIKQI